MKKRYSFALFCLLACQDATAYYLDARLISGQVKGFSQTPKGGTPNSSSTARPSFGELNIDYDTFYEYVGGFDFNEFEIYGQYHRIHLKGSEVLRQNITTHGQTIAAGNPFEATFDYRWYTLGLAYTYPTEGLLLIPSIELDYLDYRYTFASIASSSRSFSSVTPRVGLRLCYPMNPAWTVNLSGSTAIPLTNLEISRIDLSLHWLAVDDLKFQITPYAGVGFLKIDFEDNQTRPNHYRYKLQPNLSAGVRLIF
ncbi:MAG: hypothetical protein U1E78_00610 [Gammaproteobacteria bacterium]|jgi:hypothetical protein